MRIAAVAAVSAALLACAGPRVVASSQLSPGRELNQVVKRALRVARDDVETLRAAGAYPAGELTIDSGNGDFTAERAAELGGTHYVRGTYTWIAAVKYDPAVHIAPWNVMAEDNMTGPMHYVALRVPESSWDGLPAQLRPAAR